MHRALHWPDVYGLTGVYVRGPLTVQGYFQSREFDNGLNDTDHVDEYGAGAEYRFGAFRVALSYGMADTELPAGGSVEHDAWSVGVGVNAEPRAFAVGILHHF